MSGFLPPVVMKIMANGSQFVTENGRVRASMDETAAKARLSAAAESAAYKSAAVAAESAARAQILAADTATKAAAVAADKTIAAQAKAAAATGDAQVAAVNAAELAAAKEAQAYEKAAAAAQLATDKIIAANDARAASDKATAAEADLSAGAGSGVHAKTSAGGAMAGGMIAAGLAAAAVYSLDQAKKYEQETTLLQTAGGELASNMGVVTSGILKVAAATGTTTDQLAQGMFTVEKAGYRGADGLNVLKDAAEGAKAENADMGTVTNALTSIMMSYHMKSSQATSATNMLVAGAGAAKTTMQEYAGSLSTVLPVASAAGISFAQVAGGIATLTQHGTSANESTQELANTIRNLQAPNNVASKAMQQLGLNVNDVSTKLGQRGLTGTIGLITDAIASHLGPGGTVLVDTMKKSATASSDLQTMMGKMPAGMAASSKAFLDGSISQMDYQKSFKSMGAAGSAQGKQFMTLAQTVKGYNDQIKAGGPAAQTAAASLKAIMGGATGMNTALMLSSVTAKGGGENMATFKTKVDEVAAAGRKGGTDISTWAKTQQILSVQVDKTKQSVEAAAISIGMKLAPAAKIVLGGLQALFGFMSSNSGVAVGVGVALAGVAAVLLGLWAVTKTVSMAQTAWRGATLLSVAAQKIFNTGNLDSIRLMGMYGAEAVANGAKSVGSAVKAGVAWAVNGAKGVVDSIRLMAMYGAQAVVNGAKAVGAAAVAGAAWVANGVKTAASFAVTTGVMVGQTAAMIAMKAAQLAGAAATGVATAAQWALNVALDANPIALVVIAVALLIGAVVLAYNKIGWFKDAVNAVWKFLSTTTVDIFKNIASFLVTTWTNVVKFVTTVIGNVVSWISGHWGLLLGILTGPLGLAIYWIVSNFGGIVSFFSGVWQNIVSGVSSMVGRVLSWFQGLPGQILGALSGAGAWLYSVGSQMIQGLINGVSGMINAAVGAVQSVGGSMLSGIKSFLGIHSPSREFMAIGNWVTLGLAKGVTDKGAAATAAVVSVAQRLTNAATAHFKKAASLDSQVRTPTSRNAAVNAQTLLHDQQLKAQAVTERHEAAQLDRAAASVRAGVNRINQLASQKVALAARLKTAQANLNTTLAAENKEASTVSGNLSGQFNLSSMVGYAGSDMVAGAQAMATQIKAFAGKVNQLKALGLSPTLIGQVANLGAVDGSTVADSLIAGGKTQVSQLNAAYTAIGTASTSTGSAIATDMYGTGVNALKGLVSGLTGNLASVDKAAKTLTDRLMKQVKANLGIHSPSRRMRDEVGIMLGLGVIDGINGVAPQVASAMNDLATVPDISVGTSNTALGLAYTPSGYGGKGGAPTQQTINVNVNTNADPNKIAAAVGAAARKF